jgi:hypothetical protein
MKNVKVPVLCLVMALFTLSCDKEDSKKPINPTEEVALTLKFSFQYASTDISLKKVSAYLKLSEESSSVIKTASTNLSGQPNSYDLVLNISGQSAKQIIGELVYINTEVVYMVGDKETSRQIEAKIKIHGGIQSHDFTYDLVSVKSIKVIVNTYFAYGFDVLLIEYLISLYNLNIPFPNDLLDSDFIEDIETKPEKIKTTFILEGQEALENIGKELLLYNKAWFRIGGDGFRSYSDEILFIAQEGVQEFEFYFAHPPSAGD